MSSSGLSILVLSLFLILNILDGHSTWLVLRPYHYTREKNIIARFIFQKLGLVKGIIIFKFFLLALLSIIIWYFVLPEYLTLNVTFLIGDLIFILVVANNYRIYRKLARNRLK